MYFRLLQDERSACASYLLADLEAGEAVLVDPRSADLALLQAMMAEQRLRLRWLLRTHNHDSQIPTPELEQLQMLGAPIIQGLAHDGRLLPFGGESIEVLATPGHTPDCLSFRWRDRVFCGGLLAMDACPYQREPVDPQALWESVMRRLFRLADETLLFSAHAHQGQLLTLLYQQRRWHPWFARTSRDEFLTRQASRAEHRDPIHTQTNQD
nr:hypothetical protein [uncultured Roseateles sp.]